MQTARKPRRGTSKRWVEGNGKHGQSSSHHRTATYYAWGRMHVVCRCPQNRRFARYGAKGATVCEAWQHSFAAFFADMGEKPPGTLLLRRDPDKPFEPGNCFWGTKEQRNQIMPPAGEMFLTVNGVTRSRRGWARAAGLATETIQRRLEAGQSAEDAVRPRPILEFDGRRMSKAAWARKLGVNHSVLNWRIAHWGLEKALTTPKVQPDLIAFKGRKMSVFAWAKVLGMSWAGLTYRIERWGVAKALSTPMSTADERMQRARSQRNAARDATAGG